MSDHNETPNNKEFGTDIENDDNIGDSVTSLLELQANEAAQIKIEQLTCRNRLS